MECPYCFEHPLKVETHSRFEAYGERGEHSDELYRVDVSCPCGEYDHFYVDDFVDLVTELFQIRADAW